MSYAIGTVGQHPQVQKQESGQLFPHRLRIASTYPHESGPVCSTKVEAIRLEVHSAPQKSKNTFSIDPVYAVRSTGEGDSYENKAS